MIVEASRGHGARSPSVARQHRARDGYDVRRPLQKAEEHRAKTTASLK